MRETSCFYQFFLLFIDWNIKETQSWNRSCFLAISKIIFLLPYQQQQQLVKLSQQFILSAFEWQSFVSGSQFDKITTPRKKNVIQLFQ